MRLYTAKQAAELLQISIWTVWKWGREGKIKTVHFGRTVKFDLSDLLGKEYTDES